MSWQPRRKDERLSGVYFDSDDLRLARWGAELLLPRRAGLDVKLPGGDCGVLLVRGEVVVQGSRRTPPLGAIDLVNGYPATPTCIPRPACARFAAGSCCRTANEGR